MEAVHTIDGVPVARIPVDGRGHRATGWWGMMFFIITEGTLFAYLLFSYFYVGAQSRTWPPGGPPELTLAIVNTVILVVSSIPMRLGTLAIRRAARGALVGWAIVTVLLGAPPDGVELDAAERAAIGVLADSGLVPPLRLRRAAG